MEAENGRTGIEKLEERLPSAILLDLMMPEMDGFQFVETVRNHKKWRTIPIIIVTAKSLTPKDRQRLNGYVAKIIQKGVYEREELLREVGRMLGSV